MERVGANAIVTDDKEELMYADKIIFPGVGEASSAMRFLKEKKMDGLIADLKQPVLGICLGMQLMCRFSEEGHTDCLGIFDKTVKHFKGNEKVPQVGWNTIKNLNSPLFAGIKENEFMYFVHGYYVEKGAQTIAVADHMGEYSAAIHKNNFYAVQFHPEKSGMAGEQVIKNFLVL